MKYSIIILSILMSLSYSKVMYADKGEAYSGLGFAYDSNGQTGGDVASMQLEYSIITYNTEYSLGYTHGVFEDDSDSYFNHNINGWGVAGAYHIRYPLVNIALEVGGIMSSVGAQYLEDSDLTMDGYGYNIGIGLHRPIIKKGKFEIIPFVGCAIIASKTKLKDPLYVTTDKRKDNGFKAGLGIKLESPWCSSNYITIQPEVTKIGDYSNLSISIGTLINMVDSCY